MKKKLIPAAIMGTLTATLLACAPTGTNKDKPVIFYNRQPSQNNVVNKDVMNHTANTYYAGFDAVGGGTTQGQMIVDYIKAHAAEMDRNGDGTIGYVLAIGQNSHNDSAARTIGVRKALGTGETAVDTTSTKKGSITVGEKTYQIEELAAKEMRDEAGPWSSTNAGNTMDTWINQFGDRIDLVVSNNDGMAEGMISKYGTGVVIPTFGYDANMTTLELIKKGGSMKGTISQNHHAQVLTCLQLVRNMIDGLTGEEVYTSGFTKADKWGNQIKSANVAWNADDRSMLAENGIITKDNVEAAIADTLDAGITKTATGDPIKVLWTVYSSTDNFLNQSFIPTLKKYAPYYNVDLSKIVYGDGTQESSITNNFTGLENYDAYVINMVETTSGPIYQELLDA